MGVSIKKGILIDIKSLNEKYLNLWNAINDPFVDYSYGIFIDESVINQSTGDYWQFIGIDDINLLDTDYNRIPKINDDESQHYHYVMRFYNVWYSKDIDFKKADYLKMKEEYLDKIKEIHNFEEAELNELIKKFLDIDNEALIAGTFLLS